MDVLTYGNRSEDSYLGWLTFLCSAIALHVCQITFEHHPGVVYKNSGAWVFLQPDFCQLINVCC